jgi:hypothetical protein
MRGTTPNAAAGAPERKFGQELNTSVEARKLMLQKWKEEREKKVAFDFASPIFHGPKRELHTPSKTSCSWLASHVGFFLLFAESCGEEIK